jgi:hypothetical protein
LRAVDAEPIKHSEHERGWHQEGRCEHLSELFAFNRRCAQYVLFAVQREAMTVIEAPVCDFMSNRVPLYRDRPLRRDEDAASTFRNESTEQIVHRHECQPEVKLCAEPEHVDLLPLIDL